MSEPITSSPLPRRPFIGLALSGGGSRAMAFHLGCLRALHDRGLLGKVRVLSTVSGGSVIGACYAYSSDDFVTFDRKLVELLRKGIQRMILRELLTSAQGVKILLTLVVSGLPSAILWCLSSILCVCRTLTGAPTRRIERALVAFRQSLPVWGSLTTAFEQALKKLFGSNTVLDVARPDLHVVINACDLKTGTAFRFGSQRSGAWRYGKVVGPAPTVAKAVAASAAFPIILPPLIETFQFSKAGNTKVQTVVLTDGGVFDNLGVSVLEPGRDGDITDTYPVTHIISLNAGPGQLDGGDHPFWCVGRVTKSFEAVHRKSQDHVYSRLHRHVETGELDGFGMVYLGQQDHRLPYKPPDLVTRDTVRDYPTDFAPISVKDLSLLTMRGEQLTHIIIDRYLPQL
ncbi:patatin-like phospholipase family protein [Bradyrhizobium archetypum]|uniref:Patatin n=1 Tax=Bradyrhizobium archetypum TaxID=2721160 RepID=A0A7Y4H791_9BRAD|nr:patatin-like phospholipase family protein [Bradyrhizobium archetypum]NOJ48532.1 patatin [Bradyrhizobium archetypum]